MILDSRPTIQQQLSAQAVFMSFTCWVRVDTYKLTCMNYAVINLVSIYINTSYVVIEMLQCQL